MSLIRNCPEGPDALTTSEISPIEWAPGAGTINGRTEDDDMELLKSTCDAYMAKEVEAVSDRFLDVTSDRLPLLRRVLETKFGPEFPSVPDGQLLPPNEIRMAASWLLEN